MMLIVFPNGTEWYKANWVFRVLSYDLAGSVQGDPELAHELEVAQAYSTLVLNDMGTDLCARALHAIRTVGERTIRGELPDWSLWDQNDEVTQRQYLRSIAELAELVRKQMASGDSQQHGSTDTGRAAT